MRKFLVFLTVSFLSLAVWCEDEYNSILDQKLDDLYLKYSNNETKMSNEQLKYFLTHFAKTVQNQTQHQHHDEDHSYQTKPDQNIKCLAQKLDEIYNYMKSSNSTHPFVDKIKFKALQNWIVYEIDFCSTASEHHGHVHGTSKIKNWIFGFGSALVISIVGFLCYLVVPSSDSAQFKYFFQFLVALAVGTLSGDSLIHLIPHAFSEPGHTGHENHDDHLKGVWKGLSAVVGIYVFFLIEKIMMIRRARKEKRHRKMELKENSNTNESTTQHQGLDPSFYMLHANKELKYISQYLPNNSCNINIHHHDCEHETKHFHKHETDQVNSLSSFSKCDTKLIKDPCVCEPEPVHGHSHKHHIYKSYREKAHHDHHVKHEKEVNDIKLIAWMVIMGDGLHNFADGLAIGLSFATSLTGGFATSVAVLCHELPHEIGDFAVLRRAGVSLRRALFFNAISGVLCMFGVLVGFLIHELIDLKSWSYLFIAGTFLYISLVDMIPELSENKEDDNIINFVIQSLGIMCGVGTMLAIAILEEFITKVFQF